MPTTTTVAVYCRISKGSDETYRLPTRRWRDARRPRCGESNEVVAYDESRLTRQRIE